MSNREKRNFKMDPQLLLDVIKRQAGSLWKAVIEGVMNSIDAGASKCDIELTRQMLSIRDDGKGFRSREDIEQYFEVFGKPHDAREQKTFGRFRMGRGQLFAFGHNIWRSGEFEMNINVERDGLDYHLKTGMDHEDGCAVTVQLYDELTHTQFAQMVDQIQENCKYVAVPTTLNGKEFATKRASVPWDLELPEADIRFRQNQDLRIYNQGIKVLSFYRYQHGVGGDIVTKMPIKVNFARNDVMDSCPVWKKIVAAIQKHVNDEQARRAAENPPEPASTRRGSRAPAVRLTEQDRSRLIAQAKDGNIEPTPFKNARVFKRWRTRANATIRQIHNVCKGRVTMPPAANSSWTHRDDIDQIHMNQMACVLDRSLLTRWGYDKPEDIVKLANQVIGADRYRLTYLDWDDLVESLHSKCQPVPDEQLNRIEQIVLGTIRENLTYALRACPERRSGGNVDARFPVTKRRLVLGRGPRHSWTDGKTFIALNREMVREVKAGPTAWNYYLHLIRHEALHTVNTGKDHKHSQEFYRRYHKWNENRWSAGHFQYECMTSLPHVASRVNQRLTEAELREVDQVERSAQTAESIPVDSTEEEPEPAVT